MHFMPERRGGHTHFHGGSHAYGWGETIGAFVTKVLIILLVVIIVAAVAAYLRRRARTGAPQTPRPTAPPVGFSHYTGYAPPNPNGFPASPAPFASPTWHPHHPNGRR
ncbi:hypothetical protein [Williamsia sp. M5A3_1d]